MKADERRTRRSVSHLQPLRFNLCISTFILHTLTFVLSFRVLPFILYTSTFLFLPSRVLSQDNYEIQVYSYDTVEPGHTMVELHSNFTFEGSKTRQDGVLPSEHAWHETVEITLRNGIACLSDSELNDSFHALPPLIGTEMGVSYVCSDAAGNIVDAGTMSITRQR